MLQNFYHNYLFEMQLNFLFNIQSRFDILNEYLFSLFVINQIKISIFYLNNNLNCDFISWTIIFKKDACPIFFNYIVELIFNEQQIKGVYSGKQKIKSKNTLNSTFLLTLISVE